MSCPWLEITGWAFSWNDPLSRWPLWWDDLSVKPYKVQVTEIGGGYCGLGSRLFFIRQIYLQLLSDDCWKPERFIAFRLLVFVFCYRNSHCQYCQVCLSSKVRKLLISSCLKERPHFIRTAQNSTEMLPQPLGKEGVKEAWERDAVSYTHLTLPTILRV